MPFAAVRRPLLALALALAVIAALAACSPNEYKGGLDPTTQPESAPPVTIVGIPTLTPTPPPPTPTPTPVPTVVPPTPEPEVLRLVYWQAPTLPFSYLAAGTKDVEAASITLEPLALYGPDANLVPRLAKEIPSVENGGVSEDSMTVTWRLKDGLQWSDGTDVTSRDVIFTWQYCAAEGAGCIAADSFELIDDITAIDAREFQITLTEAAASPQHVFVGAGLPIISADQFAACLGPAARTCDEQNTAPLGTGPFRIVEFVAGDNASSVLYERNPYYHGPAPYFDNVILTGGGTAEEAAFKVLFNDVADYAWNLQIAPDQLAEVAEAGRGRLITPYASSVERVVLNQTNPDPALGENRSEHLDGQNPHPFLSFAPIRQAMSMAIDRQRIVDDYYGVAGRPTCNIIAAPAQFSSDANDACLMQDIAGAQALLDANGVIDTNADGIREHNGVPLRIVFQTSANAVREGTFGLLQEWWREIGIESELVTHNASVFFGGDPAVETASFRRFFADAQMFTIGPGPNPQGHLSDYRCAHVPQRANSWADANTSRMCDQEYDALYDALAETTPGPERQAAVKQLNDVIVQQAYEIPLVWRALVSATANTLLGVKPNAWDTELWNIGEWHR